MCTIFPLFQSPGMSKCHFSWQEAWQLCQPVPSGLWDASPQIPQIYGHSGSSGGHKLDLSFQWEGLFSPSSHPAVRPFKRCEKRGCHWRLKQKFVGMPAFSSSIAISSPALWMGGRVYTFFDLPFLVNLPVGALPVILCVQLCLGLGLTPSVHYCPSSFILFLGQLS